MAIYRIDEGNWETLKKYPTITSLRKDFYHHKKVNGWIAVWKDNKKYGYITTGRRYVLWQREINYPFQKEYLIVKRDGTTRSQKKPGEN